MEDNEKKEAVNQLYEYTAKLLVEEKKKPSEVKAILVQQGVDNESASIVVDTLEKQINQAKKESGNKDMLYGAMWCIGGIVATVADLGYVFWGAIVFGAIQFIKGQLIQTKGDLQHPALRSE